MGDKPKKPRKPKQPKSKGAAESRLSKIFFGSGRKGSSGK